MSHTVSHSRTQAGRRSTPGMLPLAKAKDQGCFTVLARVSYVPSAAISLAGFTHRVPNH